MPRSAITARPGFRASDRITRTRQDTSLTRRAKNPVERSDQP
jgi:hypothetical protein